LVERQLSRDRGFPAASYRLTGPLRACRLPQAGAQARSLPRDPNRSARPQRYGRRRQHDPGTIRPAAMPV